MCQLQEWNGRIPGASPHTLHHLVLHHGHDRPHALAVSSWDGELTYQMLDVVSAHLATKLIKLGVSSGTFVPRVKEYPSPSSQVAPTKHTQHSLPVGEEAP
jgi:non-ribosomal peptide synthetase component F